MNSKVIGILGGCILTSLAASAQSLVTSSGALNPNDHLDWGTLGNDGTVLTSPINTSSSGGLSLNISSGTGGSVQRVDQGTSWSGNFVNGSHLLWTVANGPFTANGPLQFNLTTPILGAGLLIAPDYAGAFTAQIQAFSGPGGSTYLGTWTENGNSTGAPTYIGITNPSATITSFIVSLSAVTTGNNTDDFAVNQLDLKTAVPEPSQYAGIVGAALVGLGVWRKVRR